MSNKYLKFYALFAVVLIVLVSAFMLADGIEPTSEVVIDGYQAYTNEATDSAAESSGEAAEKTFADTVAEINGVVNSFAWGPIMLALLVGTGICYTVLTKGFQFKNFGMVMRETIGQIFSKKKKEEQDQDGSITPFQALTTAMAATVGTGNIAGVTGAIVLGGPGAIFWMWVSALFGMMTKFAEVVLAVHFREKNEKGEWIGGPMYYIKNGLGKGFSWLSVIFAVLGSLAAFGIGNMTQVNTIASSIVTAIDSVTASNIVGTTTEFTLRLAIGIAVAVFVGFVVIGGVKRIGKVTEKLVPFMALLYVVGALVVVIVNIGSIGSVFASIFQAAFAPQAVVGGVSGFVFMNAVRRGVGRGVFSNEAGLGSAPIAHASTSEKNPVKQGLFGVFEVFMDTIVICTLTSLVVLMSGIVVPWGNGDLAGVSTTTLGFASVFGSQFASIFVALAIICFATSTVLSWQLYGERCFGFLTKGKFTIVYKVVFIGMILVGATMNLSLAWDIADTLNGLMAIPNLVALVLLSGTVVKLTKEYLEQRKAQK